MDIQHTPNIIIFQKNIIYGNISLKWLKTFTSMLDDSSSSRILSVITLISLRIAPSSRCNPDNCDFGDFLDMSPLGTSPFDLNQRY